jgi:hypothetical protein
MAEVSAVDAPAQHVRHRARGLILGGPRRPPPPRYPADLISLSAGGPVGGRALIGALFRPLPDGAQARLEDQVQQRGLGDALRYDGIGQLGKRLPLGRFPRNRAMPTRSRSVSGRLSRALTGSLSLTAMMMICASTTVMLGKDFLMFRTG